MIIAAPGSHSEGLSTRVLPVLRAIGIDHKRILLTYILVQHIYAEELKYARREAERRNTTVTGSV